MATETTASIASPLSGGLGAVEQEIARACKDARRDRASVTLIAVSKTFGADAISPVIAAGQRVFGENRVQEAKAKWPGLMTAYPGIVLHLIGPLQSNKAKEAVALFDAIHSVDRPSICEALAKEIKSQGRSPELFVQLNTGEESQKAGVAPSEADAFIARVVAVNGAASFTVDLPTQTISGPGGPNIVFDIAPADRIRLLEGLDDIGLTLKHTDEIVAFEKRVANTQPWLQTATDSRVR